MKRLALAFAVLLAFSATAFAGGVITPAEDRYSPYTGVLPPCDDPSVLGTITGRFEHKESSYWNSPLQILGYDRIQEIGYRANGLAYIPRRYCIARATLSDTKLHPVVYQIQENLGLFGFPFSFDYGVEWCVVGLDRNLAYAPACSALRPYVERFLGENALSERY